MFVATILLCSTASTIVLTSFTLLPEPGVPVTSTSITNDSVYATSETQSRPR